MSPPRPRPRGVHRGVLGVARASTASTIIEPAQGDGLLAATTTHERFTMDPGYQRAVRKVFVDWFDEGLIYRGKRIINWCPRCSTALSDIEVEHEDVDSHLWHIRYPLKEPVGGVDHVVVATTRPETMLGDTCVAVHPDDERYTRPRRRDRRAAAPRPRDPDRRRRVRRPGVRHRRGEGHARARPQRLRDRRAARLRQDQHPERRRDHHRGGRPVRRARPLRGAQARRRRPRGARAARQDRRARPLGRPLLPLPHGHRAVALRPVVRRHEAAGRAGHRGRPRRAGHASTRSAGRTSTSTGWRTSATGASRASCGGATASRSSTATRAARRSRRWTTSPPARSAAAPVRQDEDVLDTWFSSQLWPFATLGWPEPDPRARLLLPDERALHRARHPVPLGRAHDHERHVLRRRRDPVRTT